MIVAVLMFIGSLLVLRGYWRPAIAASPAAAHGTPAHAAGGR
jgi:hypothetical protein